VFISGVSAGWPEHQLYEEPGRARSLTL